MLAETLDTLSCELHREWIGAGMKSANVVDNTSTCKGLRNFLPIHPSVLIKSNEWE